MIAREARARVVLGGVCGALALGLPMAWLWGFSVDDAWITARVAAHIARGLGHRFNIDGPVVDAVTPLGFAYLLAPLSGGDPLRALTVARWLGAVSGVAAALWLGREIARVSGSELRFGVLVPLALSAPLAAWCVSGMETGVVVLLSTLALSTAPLGSLAAGLAGGLRPELVPWSVALSLGRSVARKSSHRDLARGLLFALGPAVGVAAVRALAFGHAVPLAFFAKPSDAAHGLYYVLGALLWTGAPVLVLSPRGLRGLDGESQAVLVATCVHAGALVLAGGDWMALFRLFVPVLPGLFLVGARLAAALPPALTVVRFCVATAISAALLVDKGAVARGVLAQRLALVHGAALALSGARQVAALDVGWVGAATDADIVDLAGVTDESIARLKGGHTSKKVPEHLLEHRGVDALVLLMSGEATRDLASLPVLRAVEARVAREAADLGFTPRVVLPLSGTDQRYVVLRSRNSP